MKVIQLPETLKLVDGSEVKLAKIAMNRKFIEFMAASKSAEPDPVRVIELLLGVLGDCITNGNKELTADEVAARCEMIPLDAVIELIENAGS